MGEGWHNYHHVFPWDYKAAELGNYSTNLSTAVIDLAAKYGNGVHLLKKGRSFAFTFYKMIYAASRVAFGGVVFITTKSSRVIVPGT